MKLCATHRAHYRSAFFSTAVTPARPVRVYRTMFDLITARPLDWHIDQAHTCQTPSVVVGTSAFDTFCCRSQISWLAYLLSRWQTSLFTEYCSLT